MMIRWINWLEEHIDGFFKLNAFLWLIWLIVGIAITPPLFDWPKNSISTWSNFQWYIVKQTIVFIFIGLLIFILFSKKKYFAFPFAFIYSVRFLHFALLVIAQILEGNFLNLPANLLNVALDQMVFIPAILGTIIWGRKVFL